MMDHSDGRFAMALSTAADRARRVGKRARPRRALSATHWPVSEFAPSAARTQVPWRHALQAPERASKFIIAEAGEYRLDCECFSVDVDDCDRCIREARVVSGDKSIRWREQAVSLYAGEYLDNLYYDRCLPERDRLREACLGALRALVVHYATADPQRAIAFGQRAIAIDPLLEDVHLERCNAIIA